MATPVGGTSGESGCRAGTRIPREDEASPVGRPLEQRRLPGSAHSPHTALTLLRTRRKSFETPGEAARTRPPQPRPLPRRPDRRRPRPQDGRSPLLCPHHHHPPPRPATVDHYPTLSGPDRLLWGIASPPKAALFFCATHPIPTHPSETKFPQTHTLKIDTAFPSPL